ncbi:MAG TPA: iron ABC transporter permease [Candidatus Sumerlaeota bacterium]|nr:MAG: Hemin transport system permease protein HmuU [candidate division BRC1 bacterium ADurb.BinA292]HOE96792.1 iron ABC transporter permease [Candidatus Sumerlaeota bacterium]HOR29233.1 iron ABC transporter permease [Candidatus Sumerlaeota bacterium]HPK01176.1 iron ABC transporter permease [Candidatus Sumerlaeota bacterium]
MALLTARRFLLVLAGYALFALAAMLAAPMFGAEPVNVPRALSQWWETRGAAVRPYEVDILLHLRLPRILLAFLTGGALAVTGAVFQALLRNPLATPYTLGVASGGSFGAVLAFFLPAYLPWIAFELGPFNYVQCLSFAGSLGAMALIYGLARTGGRISTMELLLAGVTLGMIFSSLILAVRYFASPHIVVNMDRWLMGGLSVTGYGEVRSVLPFLAVGLGVQLGLARALDQLGLGEELAQSRGVNVARLQALVFVFGSLAVASVVAVAGLIGFVGLIVPHTARRLTGPDHRLLLPASLLAGGGFLVLCDTVARTIIAPTELPVGIITSLLGGPFFIYLLVRSRRGGRMWGVD